MRRHILLALLLCNTAPALWAQTSPANNFPSKPIRILVGFMPGGGPDTTARLLSRKLGESWKQAVVVENRFGTVGIEPVTSSPEQFDKPIANEVATFPRLANTGTIKLDKTLQLET